MSTNLNIRVISYMKNTEFFALLPTGLQVQGMLEKSNSVYKTKAIAANYNESYEIYMNDEGIDIQPSSLRNPTDNTMNVYNVTDSQLEVIILSNGETFFSVSIDPNSKLNFCIIPLIYISIYNYSIEQQYFNAASLSPLTMIDYRGQPYLTIVLSENYSTGKFFVNYNFDAFDLTGAYT